MEFKQIEEIQEFNASFHNFKIESLEFCSSSLIIKTILPWAKLWNEDNFTLYIHYNNCTFLDCEYYPILNDEKIEAYPGKFIYQTEELHSNNPQKISELSLTILNSSFNAPNRFVFWCKSELNIEVVKIIFNADSIQFFNSNKTEIPSSDLKMWKEKWWESIFG